MESYYETILKALLRRWKYIVLVTCLAGFLAVVKELVFPLGYRAESLLVVTSSETGSEIDGLIPPALNPKVYVDLITSQTVLGEVLTKLESNEAFQDDPPPDYDELLTMIGAVAPEVDQTTRPVQLSPMITLTVRGDKAERVTAIAETWTQTAVDTAQRAVGLHLAASHHVLMSQEKEYKTEYETILKEQEQENAQWNLTLLQAELDQRAGLVNGLLDERVSTERDLRSKEKLLETVRTLRAGEPQFLELFQAPSSTAYFIVEETKDKAAAEEGASSGLEEKGMITQTLNNVYWELKAQENNLESEIASLKSRLEIIDRQTEQLTGERDQYKATVAEHQRIQIELATKLSVLSDLYVSIANAQARSEAVGELSLGRDDEGTIAIGLNRLSDTIYAREDKGLLGRKGRVILITFLAAALAGAYVLFIEVLKPYIMRILRA